MSHDAAFPFTVPRGPRDRQPRVLCPPAQMVHDWPISTKVLVSALQRGVLGWVPSEKSLGAALSGPLGDRMQT